MKNLLFSITFSISLLMLGGCMPCEEAAKHITVTLVESPEAQLNDWHPIPTNVANTTTTSPSVNRFESPLGRIEISQTSTKLTTITQPQVINLFNILKQDTEQQIASSHSSLINPANDDSLQLADHDFLHTTYRTRDSNNLRQHIELYLAPINGALVTIIVQIGDDVDMQSYNQLQVLLAQRVDKFNKR